MSASLHGLGYRTDPMAQKQHCEQCYAPIKFVSSYWAAVGVAGLVLTAAGRGPFCVRTALGGAAWATVGLASLVWARIQVNDCAKQ